MLLSGRCTLCGISTHSDRAIGALGGQALEFEDDMTDTDPAYHPLAVKGDLEGKEARPTPYGTARLAILLGT